MFCHHELVTHLLYTHLRHNFNESPKQNGYRPIELLTITIKYTLQGICLFAAFVLPYKSGAELSIFVYSDSHKFVHPIKFHVPQEHNGKWVDGFVLMLTDVDGIEQNADQHMGQIVGGAAKPLAKN